MKKKKITPKTNIFEAMQINPKLHEILSREGLGCMGCAFANVETLEQGLKAHGFKEKEIDELIEEMNK